MKKTNFFFKILLILVFLAPLAFAGSKKQERSSRGIASFLSPSKKIIIKREGLYIPHKELRHVSHKDKVRYYLFFAVFLEEVAKNKKFSLNTPTKVFDQMLIPQAHAARCLKRGFVASGGECAPTAKEEPRHLNIAHCKSLRRAGCLALGIDSQKRAFCQNGCTDSFRKGGTSNLVGALDL